MWDLLGFLQLIISISIVSTEVRIFCRSQYAYSKMRFVHICLKVCAYFSMYVLLKWLERINSQCIYIYIFVLFFWAEFVFVLSMFCCLEHSLYSLPHHFCYLLSATCVLYVICSFSNCVLSLPQEGKFAVMIYWTLRVTSFDSESCTLPQHRICDRFLCGFIFFSLLLLPGWSYKSSICWAIQTFFHHRNHPFRASVSLMHAEETFLGFLKRTIMVHLMKSLCNFYWSAMSIYRFPRSSYSLFSYCSSGLT